MCLQRSPSLCNQRVIRPGCSNRCLRDQGNHSALNHFFRAQPRLRDQLMSQPSRASRLICFFSESGQERSLGNPKRCLKRRRLEPNRVSAEEGCQPSHLSLLFLNLAQGPNQASRVLCIASSVLQPGLINLTAEQPTRILHQHRRRAGQNNPRN